MTRTSYKTLGATASSSSRISFQNLRENRSTAKQRALLRDLWIIISGNLPSPDVERAWALLSVQQARDLIRDYYRRFGRAGNYDGGLDESDPEVEHLSPRGRAFVRSGFDPYFDVGLDDT
ncbi:protein of unknown function [Microbacterium sp. Nx66]|nr:protein of unknown function [Microbacterium sp. Nx66]